MSYISPTSVDIRYVTGTGKSGPGALTYQPPHAPSAVRYSVQPKGPFKLASGNGVSYTQVYNFAPESDFPYTSPLIHHVRLTGDGDCVPCNEMYETCEMDESR